MAGMFGSKTPPADDLDEFEDIDLDDEGSDGPEALVLDLEPMGPPEHIRMMAEEVVGKDEAKVTALYELVKAVLAEGDMPEPDEGGLPDLEEEFPS